MHCASLRSPSSLNLLTLSYAHSDPNERAHFWLPGAETQSAHEMLDSALTDRMYIDTGEIVRVRVETDEFNDDEPGPPKATDGVQQARDESRRPPYTITVSNTADEGCRFH